MATEYRLIYDHPADAWADAMPLGNGRLGAMAYGHTNIERLQLNEDSLWYGGFIDRNNPRLKDALPEIRRHVFAGEIREAEDLIQRYMVGAPCSMRHYESMGELDVAINEYSPFAMGWCPDSSGAENYHGELDLMTGVQTITWSAEGVNYTRQVFISHPDHVLCLRVTADTPGAITLNAQLDRCLISDDKEPDDRRPGRFRRGGGWSGMLLDENHTRDAHTLIGKGNAGGTRFAIAVRMQSDGSSEDPYTQLYTSAATQVCLYLAAATENRVADPEAEALSCVEAAEAKGYDALYHDHVADFQALMRACTLDLPGPDDMPTDRRIERARSGEEDPGLAALFFTMGRYLMVSGGRADSTALNLQGIWCRDFIPAWDSKYTTNINVQMNYWPADVTNLGEIHASLFDLIARICERGKVTAEVMYGMRGSVCHHNTDYYGDCAPQDRYMASTSWTTGGAWLALHLWDHFQFTRDLDFLRRWQPVMKQFALFFLDFLTDDGSGHLVTCPSLSPENRYVLPDGYDTPICAGPAMDNQILRELFAALIQSDRLLGLNDPLTPEFERARARLPEDKIGSQGQLLEWATELPELTPGMSHISHLFGAHPGAQINWRDTPDLLKAVGRSLALRVAGARPPTPQTTEQSAPAGRRFRGGWPQAWKICQYARQMDAQKTGDAIAQIVLSSPMRSFFSTPVFQIDGILGGTAGIAEALLQSHTGIVHLLPALPPRWTEGEVKGLVARGGVTVDLTWGGGTLTSARLHAAHTAPVEVRADVPFRILRDGNPVTGAETPYGLRFDAEAGAEYYLEVI